MKEVRVEDAVGMVLCHDITKIIPGEFKGCGFKKGHIVRQEDIGPLLDMGKRHVFVWDLGEGYVHENDAAQRMAIAASGSGICRDGPQEGKISFKAAETGLLKINTELLYRVNEAEEICFSTIHGNKLAVKGKPLAGCRVIPLAVREELISEFEKACLESGPIIKIIPIKAAKIGVVTTGSEVQSGRIKDGFGEVLNIKSTELGASVMGQVFPGDDPEAIKNAVLCFIEQGADMVAVTGGMSIDPDDRTPAAIRSCGGEVVTYGTPVLPGAMFMLSYVGGVPVVGLPGCVMYSKRTVFDLAVPRLLAGERLERRDFVRMAHGGQCLNCKNCVYPDCGFGE